MPLTFLGIHRDFLDDQSPEIDFEGSRYSGKTWACAAKVIESCLKYPGIKWVICRYSDTETRNKVRPEFQQIASDYYGLKLVWDGDTNHFAFPEVDGKISRVYAYGLRAQNKLQELEKVRGMDTCGLWVDQTEEVPQAVCEEFPFATRMPGYPHQILLSPNPPPEDHYLTDLYPSEGNPFPHRHYYRVSVYDNKHNLSPGKLEELEAMYPPTHVKHRSLILGLRGPNVTGEAVYQHAFRRDRHVGIVVYDRTRPIYEAIHQGQANPVWLAAQRTYFGGFHIIGGVMGKRLFLDDFLEVVLKYRKQWFTDKKYPPLFQTCCDPPADLGHVRFANLSAMKRAGLQPVYRQNGTAPDVREAVIQDIAALMHQRDSREGFLINEDESQWIMASNSVEKYTQLLVSGCEASYVWSDNDRSVGNKLTRHPRADEWVDGWQRCLENIYLNFLSDTKSDADTDREAREEKPVKSYRRASMWS